MNLPLNGYPRARRAQIVTERMGDTLLVFDLERGRAHALNPAATVVWRLCDGRTSTPEMVRALHEELGLPADPDIVLLALKRLDAARLLQDPGTAEPITRREVLKRLARAGVAAAVLPAIASVTAATPAYAASFPTATLTIVLNESPPRNNTTTATVSVVGQGLICQGAFRNTVINCPSVVRTSVTLQVLPGSQGGVFQSWQNGPCAGSTATSCAFTMPANSGSAITATFK